MLGLRDWWFDFGMSLQRFIANLASELGTQMVAVLLTTGVSMKDP